MSDTVAKIDINAAFQRLLCHLGNGHYARERLEAAIRANHVRLYDGDDIVNPGFFATDLCVRAKPAEDGRWSASVWPSRIGLSKPLSEYVWAVAESDIDVMISPPLKPKQWLAEAMQPHRQAGESITDAARNLVPEMKAAADAARVTHALEWGSIKNYLRDLGYPRKKLGRTKSA
jgi:hypothetical protein